DAQDKLVSTLFYNIEIYSPPSGSGSAYRSGMSVQVWSKHDMDAIRPKLLKLNNKLVAFLLENRH
ncbi:MAG: hypothetical protein QNK24_08035, partial [Desulfuromusa sp.]|nr:hypothetical protein [Desulfuromusa sp.]